MSWTEDFSGTSENTDYDKLYVDEEGDWYYNGNRIIRKDIIELFLESLLLTPGGEFLIEREQSRWSLNVVDTPFVVSRVDRIKGEDTKTEQIILEFKHLSRTEALDAATLYVGKENVLYCLIRDGRFPAKFSRPAYYQLAEWVLEDPRTGEFYVELNGKPYFIRRYQAV